MPRPTIRSYEQAAHFLGPADSRRPGGRFTTVLRLTPTTIAVRYHNTDVVIYHHPETNKLATIGAGGYVGEATARRINDYAPEGITATVDFNANTIVLHDAVTGHSVTLDKEYKRYVVYRNGHRASSE